MAVSQTETSAWREILEEVCNVYAPRVAVHRPCGGRSPCSCSTVGVPHERVVGEPCDAKLVPRENSTVSNRIRLSTTQLKPRYSLFIKQQVILSGLSKLALTTSAFKSLSRTRTHRHPRLDLGSSRANSRRERGMGNSGASRLAGLGGWSGY